MWDFESYSFEETIANYVDDQALRAKAESLLHSLKQAARDIVLNVNKTQFMSFKQDGAIFTSSGVSMK